MADYPFLKGHGTENDFVLLPDHDGSVHGELSPERVRALCDRRAGVGADGVLRVVRTAAMGAEGADQAVEWFMDYRNADGWPSEMCGNGIRVFLRHLVEERLVDPSGPHRHRHPRRHQDLALRGRPGHRRPRQGPASPQTKVSVGALTWPAIHVDMGNPHAVAFVDDEETLAGLDLVRPPQHDDGVYPDGVNVELVVRRGERHVGMRVHERGSGETRSCGTGAGAVLVATATADRAPRPATYRVDVPGGTLTLTWTPDDHVLLTGPAVIVARGTTSL